MVKVFIKGGVWKNSEDEILKAAVMKYGKQQWARVASLLNRKTAKQCKARWHEWLDPSVKKVEWSREEEEKLLHLAKLLPAQWKTIGPLIGRTATQCQEHYEQLLDEAAGGSAETRQQQSLQAGQIDSHPETKPARPDPIDMDEDEMEMLQEARARLANTQGKKAKRKAREKMLAQAKRLADLQKRRELKQAGLLSGAARKRAQRMRRKDIDLGVEIPFHKPAPAGFHDVTEEDRASESARQKRMKSVDYQKVNENQYRTRDREAAMAQKREEARLKMLEKSNMQYVVAQVSKQNDPLNIRKRGALELPEPQVATKELEQLAKLEQLQKSGMEMTGSNGHAATQALMGDYSDRPLPTPMRTPMHAGGQEKKTHESLMREASQLRKLEQGQTPLLGGIAAAGFKTTGLEDEDDGEEEDNATLSAATPRLSAPTDRKASQTPMSLAPRDALGLNTVADDATSVASTAFMSVRDMARAERRAAKRARQELEAALAALPAPQFEYELATPEMTDDNDAMEVETVRHEDAADVEAAQQEAKRKQAEKEYASRSTVVKRKELPRPPGGSLPTWKARNDAESLIREETAALLSHDARAFPVVEEGKKKQKKRKKDEMTTPEPLAVLPEGALDNARQILQQELDVVMEEKIGAAMATGKYTSKSAVLDQMAAESVAESQSGAIGLVFDERRGFVEDGDKLEALKIEYQAIRGATMNMKKKNDKAETKLGIKNGGYAKRTKALEDEILQQFAQSQNSRIEEAVFAQLQSTEVLGASRRQEKLEEEIASLESGEAVLQKKYGDLLVEKKRLLASLRRK